MIIRRTGGVSAVPGDICRCGNVSKDVADEMGRSESEYQTAKRPESSGQVARSIIQSAVLAVRAGRPSYRKSMTSRLVRLRLTKTPMHSKMDSMRGWERFGQIVPKSRRP
jgi:hypothetical protein